MVMKSPNFVDTVHKMKFFFFDLVFFFFLDLVSCGFGHILKKYLMENFIFCAVRVQAMMVRLCHSTIRNQFNTLSEFGFEYSAQTPSAAANSGGAISHFQ